MAHENLSGEELCALVTRVFQPRPGERALAFLVDLPDAARPDNAAWRARRELAASWARTLAPLRARLGLEEIGLVLYRNVRANNADLPEHARLHPLDLPLPVEADALGVELERFDALLARFPLLIAPTELSATAPLKLAAPRHGFRAATMPGFEPAMIPALRLDYDEISRRVLALCALLDGAERAELRFSAAGAEEKLVIDLRHRRAHASTGLLREPGTAGNLPSGEAYIVPYEGERAGDPSASAGVLPVELDGELVRYRVEQNRALEVLGSGAVARAERERLAAEPAYGNLAELGLGVLAELGVEPCGELLLDEKLGLHIAFGRSDHFGGVTGAARFSRPEAVVHIDRVYLPSLQPRVRVLDVELVGGSGRRVELIRDDRYALDFASPPRW